ncbi:MAG: metallophosphoesterase family protein [Oscillospiraceae bacterium]|nr:metallophosphoesterase family protein [Oscillospiraceae bacterium]
MKILAVSDEECAALWDYYVPGRLKDYDLIISCGDLKADYLSFLVTMARCPVLYVHGNHDTSYDRYPPEGCDCIDDHLVVYNGLRILGLGGCLRYHPGDYQYTDEQMHRRISKLRRKLEKLGGVDLVVTHAPPYGVGDAEDPAHHGFRALRDLLDVYHPQYLLHGHVHLRYGARTREQTYGDTQVINVSERYALDLPEIPHPEKHHGQLLWQTKHKD